MIEDEEEWIAAEDEDAAEELAEGEPEASMDQVVFDEDG